MAKPGVGLGRASRFLVDVAPKQGTIPFCSGTALGDLERLQNSTDFYQRVGSIPDHPPSIGVVFGGRLQVLKDLVHLRGGVTHDVWRTMKAVRIPSPVLVSFVG